MMQEVKWIVLSSINSLNNRTGTVTVCHRETVVSTARRAGQFGLNDIVDRPTHFLAGEGFGKERVKIQPGTMAFVEDFTKEMSQKFGQILTDPKNNTSNQNININK